MWTRLGEVVSETFQLTDPEAYNRELKAFWDETVTVKVFLIPEADIEHASRINRLPIPGNAIWLPMIEVSDEDDKDDEDGGEE